MNQKKNINVSNIYIVYRIVLIISNLWNYEGLKYDNKYYVNKY